MWDPGFLGQDGHLAVFSPQGQYCDICTAANSNKAHPVSNAIDGTERWWQSPPLSRGLEYNEVNVTLDLGQVGFIFVCAAPAAKLALGLVRSSSGEAEPGTGLLGAGPAQAEAPWWASLFFQCLWMRTGSGGLNGAPAKGTPELVPAGHRKAWQPCCRAPHALVALVFTLRNS